MQNPGSVTRGRHLTVLIPQGEGVNDDPSELKEYLHSVRESTQRDDITVDSVEAKREAKLKGDTGKPVSIKPYIEERRQRRG